MDIVYASNDFYARHLAVSMISLFDRNQQAEEITVYVLSVGITEESRQKLQKIADQYHRNLELLDLTDIRDRFDYEIDTRGFDISAMSRLFIGTLLPKTVKRVLYLDPDILVINPVRALYDTDLEGDLMAAATHTGLLAGITDPVNRLRLENYEAEAYYNSGVLVMDLSAMRREVRPGDIFDYAREHADILLLPDQDVLNGLYGGQILGVDDSLWNYDARRFDRYLCHIVEL